MSVGAVLAPMFVHFLVVATPGPANVLIMQRSASRGRVAGLVTAAGVVTGSAMWAGLVCLTMLFSLSLAGWMTVSLSLFGAAYLTYLGYSMIRASGSSARPAVERDRVRTGGAFYAQGFLLHATNPKAFFGWLAIISVGRVDEATGVLLITIVLACVLQAVAVFGGYAVAFSTDRVSLLYQRHKRTTDVAFGAILIGFGLATLYGLALDSVS